MIPVRVLAFEPDDRDFAAIGAALTRSGLGVSLEQVYTREQFVAKFRQSHPDLAIVDYSRTDGDGMQAALWCQNVPDHGGRVPVVFVTDPMGDEAAVAALKAGVHDYVLKQELSRLPNAIREALRAREEIDAKLRNQKELQRAAEQIRESQKLVNMGRISGMITHEINNPLAAISNLLYLVRQEGNLSERGVEYLDMAEKEMSRVAHIARQTLRFYREANHAEELVPQDLIEEVLALYRRMIHERGINVERRYECEQKVTTFPGEMRQVLSNLVVNAIEAMSAPGKLRIHIYEGHRWSGAMQPGVRIVIADTGRGIPAELRRVIGEPFFTTKGQRGTGLGLWVSRGILEKYGGDLRVFSSTDPRHHGTVFSLFLPFAKPQKAQADKHADRGARPRSTEDLITA